MSGFSLDDNPGDYVMARAKAAGIPLAEVCRRSGVAWSTVWRWQKGKISPSLSTLQRVTDVLDAIDREANQ